MYCSRAETSAWRAGGMSPPRTRPRKRFVLAGLTPPARRAERDPSLVHSLIVGAAPRPATATNLSLLQDRFEGLGARRAEVVAHDDAGTGIPAEDGVVVVRRTQRLGLLVPAHRLLEPRMSDGAGARAAPLQLGAAASLAEDASVVAALVFPV